MSFHAEQCCPLPIPGWYLALKSSVVKKLNLISSFLNAIKFSSSGTQREKVLWFPHVLYSHLQRMETKSTWLKLQRKNDAKVYGYFTIPGETGKSDSEQAETKESSAGMITARVQHRPAGRTCSPYPASPPPEPELFPGHSCRCPQRAPPYLGLQLGSRNSKLNSPDHSIWST